MRRVYSRMLFRNFFILKIFIKYEIRFKKKKLRVIKIRISNKFNLI